MGLELLHRSAQKRRGDSMIIKRQLRPQPRCTVGRILAGSRLVSAMIDVSDGLSTDLHNLCLQSQVGALIHASAVPVAHVASQRLTKDPLSYALNGGEDYELLFTVPSRLRKKVPRLIDGVPIHEIGHVTAQAGIWIWKGEETTPLSPKGFDHFETRLASSE
jgi:thiamine-monophosphate kinase